MAGFSVVRRKEAAQNSGALISTEDSNMAIEDESRLLQHFDHAVRESSIFPKWPNSKVERMSIFKQVGLQLWRKARRARKRPTARASRRPEHSKATFSSSIIMHKVGKRCLTSEKSSRMCRASTKSGRNEKACGHCESQQRHRQLGWQPSLEQMKQRYRAVIVVVRV
jgi:hypothetical protein